MTIDQTKQKTKEKCASPGLAVGWRAHKNFGGINFFIQLYDGKILIEIVKTNEKKNRDKM